MSRCSARHSTPGRSPQLSTVGHVQAKLISWVKWPPTVINAAVMYDPVAGTAKQVTDANGGVWKIAALTISGTSQFGVCGVPILWSHGLTCGDSSPGQSAFASIERVL